MVAPVGANRATQGKNITSGAESQAPVYNLRTVNRGRAAATGAPQGPGGPAERGARSATHRGGQSHSQSHALPRRGTGGGERNPRRRKQARAGPRAQESPGARGQNKRPGGPRRPPGGSPAPRPKAEGTPRSREAARARGGPAGNPRTPEGPRPQKRPRRPAGPPGPGKAGVYKIN